MRSRTFTHYVIISDNVMQFCYSSDDALPVDRHRFRVEQAGAYHPGHSMVHPQLFIPKFGEVVHHINGKTSDNHPDNLLAFPS